MEKIKLSSSPWVIMKDGSYKDCHITLVHQWTMTHPKKENAEMGIIVVQPKDPEDAHPFTKTVKLDELDFVAFR